MALIKPRSKVQVLPPTHELDFFPSEAIIKKKDTICVAVSRTEKQDVNLSDGEHGANAPCVKDLQSGALFLFCEAKARVHLCKAKNRELGPREISVKKFTRGEVLTLMK